MEGKQQCTAFPSLERHYILSKAVIDISRTTVLADPDLSVTITRAALLHTTPYFGRTDPDDLRVVTCVHVKSVPLPIS